MGKRLIRKRIKELTKEQERILEFIHCGFDHSHPTDTCQALEKLGLITQIGKVKVGKQNKKSILVPQWKISDIAFNIWIAKYKRRIKFNC